jgi:16S rRNA (uracil1498-N3)-methyltransferase
LRQSIGVPGGERDSSTIPAVSQPRFFAPDAAATSRTVTLSPNESHHLAHVLRIGQGAEVAVFDGRGREWLGRVAGVRKGRSVSIELLHEIRPVAEPPVRVTLAIGVLKGEQMDAVVRDATMLGAAEIAPMACGHVAVGTRGWRAGGTVDRWQRVAIASSKQCGRAVVPVVHPVRPFEAVVGGAADLRVMCVEPSAPVPSTSTLTGLARPSSALVLVGPEGGWTNDELETAGRNGTVLVNLGPRTLRAQTAPAVLLSSLWTVWGW